MTVIKAYESGQIQFENRDSSKQKHAILYVPLKGKSDIYGVLQVIAPDVSVFPSEELEFIKLLSECAGNALSNANTYQQSKRMISDLQLINQTAHQLNSNQPLVETLTFMAEQIKTSFEAQEVGFFYSVKTYKKQKQFLALHRSFLHSSLKLTSTILKGNFSRVTSPYLLEI